jgi:hypothetical protein
LQGPGKFATVVRNSKKSLFVGKLVEEKRFSGTGLPDQKSVSLGVSKPAEILLSANELLIEERAINGNFRQWRRIVTRLNLVDSVQNLRDCVRELPDNKPCFVVEDLLTNSLDGFRETVYEMLEIGGFLFGGSDAEIEVVYLGISAFGVPNPPADDLSILRNVEEGLDGRIVEMGKTSARPLD